MSMKNWLKLPTSRYTTRQIARWLWKALRGNRLQACLNASVGLIGVALSLMSVWAMQRAIDTASGAREGSIYWAIALMAVIILAEFGVGISRVWIRNILGVKAQNRMQQQLVARLLRSQWQGREAMHSGDIINRLEEDVRQVVTFLTETLPGTLSVLALFVGAFVYLFLMDPALALITVAIIPLFVALSRFYVGKMRSLTRQVRDSDSKVQSVLQETIQNRMLIKTMESDSVMVDKLESTQSELRQKVVKRTAFSVMSNLILNFGFALGYLVAFLWSALRMSAGTLTFGGMTAFLQLVNKIQGPARSLSKLVPQFVSVFTASERLMELEENPLEEQGDPIELDAPCGIRLNNISYKYNAADGDVIHNLSFDFKPATCTAILGETGAGKTTLIRLLLALLKPQSGSIEIYNTLNALTPLHRCNISYVPQGNTLMSGTIRDNLRLGNLKATDKDMREALHKSCADFVFDLPEELNTQCTEQGGGLSEGQAQRIAIARCLLRNRSILIFDEATSALDEETERKLLKNLLAEKRHTIIFITHRKAVIDYCDETLKIEKL